MTFFFQMQIALWNVYSHSKSKDDWIGCWLDVLYDLWLNALFWLSVCFPILIVIPFVFIVITRKWIRKKRKQTIYSITIVFFEAIPFMVWLDAYSCLLCVTVCVWVFVLLFHRKARILKITDYNVGNIFAQKKSRYFLFFSFIQMIAHSFKHVFFFFNSSSCYDWVACVFYLYFFPISLIFH